MRPSFFEPHALVAGPIPISMRIIYAKYSFAEIRWDIEKHFMQATTH